MGSPQIRTKPSKPNSKEKFVSLADLKNKTIEQTKYDEQSRTTNGRSIHNSGFQVPITYST